MLKKILFFFLAVISVYAQKPLEFGDARAIEELSVEKQSDDFMLGENTKTISVNIDKNAVQLFSTTNGYDLFKIDDAVSTGASGEPTSYIKSISINLPVNAIVTGVKVIGGEYVEIKNLINLAPRLKPIIWYPEYNNNEANRMVENEMIYGRDELFPGNIVKYISGDDGKYQKVYVQFYPIQYNPKRQRAILLINAQIKIDYTISQRDVGFSQSLKTTSTQAENIILTVPEFKEEAAKLKAMHETLENTKTEVVLTDKIAKDYKPAPAPKQAGYATIKSTPIRGSYKYELAKKIVSYLRDKQAHPNLKSITILGDANIVPPSYYFYAEGNKMQPNDKYNPWIVSDLFYMSPDYDMVLNYQLGRLPAANTAEAKLMINKIKSWKKNQNTASYGHTELLGGAPFGQKFLMGEIITLDVVNRGYLKVAKIGKNFLSEDRYSKANVLPHFSDENVDIIFHIDHGMGNMMGVGGMSMIGSNDIMELPAKKKFPIIISIACMNGGYDNELIDGASFQEDCFAEAVMRSKAGGICYWGGVRTNAGGPELMFDAKGELLVGDETYMAKLLQYLFRAWADGETSMGGIHNKAFEYYMKEFDKTDKMEYAAIYEFVFFGDPVLSIMPQKSKEFKNTKIIAQTKPHEIGNGSKAPIYKRTNTINIPIKIKGETNSPSINVFVHKINISFQQHRMSIANIEKKKLVKAPFNYGFKPKDDGLYFIRYETADFKERRLYFRSKTVDKLNPLQCTLFPIKESKPDGYTVNWSKSNDYDGSVESYTLKEMKQSFKTLENCANFDYWKKQNFEIVAKSDKKKGNYFVAKSKQGQGQSSLQTQFPISVNNGDKLTFKIKYAGMEQSYVGIKIEGKEVEILDKFTGSTSVWEKKSYDLSKYAGKSVKIMFMAFLMMPYSSFSLDSIYPVHKFRNVRLIDNIKDTFYVFNKKQNADAYYLVRAIDNDKLLSPWSNMEGINISSDVQFGESETNELALGNYPNPFNSFTFINFSLRNTENVKIEIFDVLGNSIALMEPGAMPAGQHKIRINTAEWKTGVYHYRIYAGSRADAGQMLLVR